MEALLDKCEDHGIFALEDPDMLTVIRSPNGDPVELDAAFGAGGVAGAEPFENSRPNSIKPADKEPELVVRCLNTPV